MKIKVYQGYYLSSVSHNMTFLSENSDFQKFGCYITFWGVKNANFAFFGLLGTYWRGRKQVRIKKPMAEACASNAWDAWNDF